MMRSPVGLALLALFAGTAWPAQTLIEQGYSDMYNLRFDDAHQAFTTYEKMQPDDPVGPVSDAAAYLFSEFDRLHVLESQFFTNYKGSADSPKLHTDLAIKARFDNDLSETQRLTASQMQQPGERANAMFAETLRLGLHADYLALIEQRDLAALADVKKARELAQQLLSENPGYFDAYIAVGVENYLLSQKPAAVRWVLRMNGAETDKQNGLAKLSITAERGHYLLPYARLLLAVAALRDGNKKKARDLLSWLVTHYPHNSLYRNELAKLH